MKGEMDTRCTCWYRTGSQSPKRWTDSMLSNGPKHGTPFVVEHIDPHFQETAGTCIELMQLASEHPQYSVRVWA